MTVSATDAARRPDGDIDLGSIGQAFWRHRSWIVMPVVIVAILTAIGVNLVAPRYKSEARVLFEGRENVFLRPEAEKTSGDSVIGDQEAVANQVQIALSREVALNVIKQLRLAERPDFDSVLGGISPLKYILVAVGISRDPFAMTAEERVLEAYYDRLTAFALEKSRVVVIEFQATDPELAARVANAIAEAYIGRQQIVKQEQSRGASQWLAGEIENLRTKVAAAEAHVENFRADTNLFVGTNNTTLSNQQLGEVNSQLAAARAQKADAETRARAIRDMLRKGAAIESSDVVNSELIRHLSEQRVTLRAQLAEQSSTLLDGHPRIKELKAQISDLDRAIHAEAEKLVRTVENDASIAGARVEALSANLDALKRQAASSNEQDVQLRALERESKAQRDLLESYLAKYREAMARETIGSASSADARTISQAMVSNTPYFPKKVPTVLVAALAAFALSSCIVLTGEVLRAGALGGSVVPAQREVETRSRLTDPKATHPALGVSVGAIADYARKLRHDANHGRRVAVFDVPARGGASLAALTLARALAKDTRAVLVDFAPGAKNLSVISSDPHALGIADVMRGACSFREVITRDKFSRLQLVTGGRAGMDLVALVASHRFATAIEALARSYDYLVVDACGAPEAALARIAAIVPRAVLVAPETSQDIIRTAHERLVSAGFSDVSVLARDPADQADTRPIAA